MVFFEEADLLKIFIFRIGLIEDVKLFVAEIYAPEAVLAALAVVAVIAVRGVAAVLRKVAIVALLDVYALVAEFRFFGKGTVG